MITEFTIKELESTLNNNMLDLIKLYDTAAAKMNITLKEDEKYDCAHILISMGVYEFYRQHAEEAYGKDGVVDLNMLLLFAGPKTDNNLKGLEIEFQEKAIRKEN